MEEHYYPDVNLPSFNKILDKFEFQEKHKHSFVYQDPRQLVLRNIISKNTIYESILLFHNLGTGKTCSSITIAEGFKEYVANMGRKILVLVKNGNIEKNFKNELLTDCSRGEYISNVQIEFLKNSKNEVAKSELMNKVTRKINKVYNFMTYGTFVNQVLGMKDYEKDDLGRTTGTKNNVSRKNQSNLLTNLNNTVIIVDEAHNITNNDVYTALSSVLKDSYNYRLVLLTATPMYDNPKEIFEISNLLNMNNSDNILPIRNELYKSYKGQGPLVIKQSILNDGILKNGVNAITDNGIKQLTKAMIGKVSYMEANTDTFPKKIDIGEPILDMTGSVKIVPCVMSTYQFQIYKSALANDSGEIGDTEEQQQQQYKSSSLYKNSSDASTMTYPNNLYGKEGFTSCFRQTNTNETEYTPIDRHFLAVYGDLEKYSSKLYNLLKNINKSPGNVFIYSSYVNYGGTSLIKQLLLANGFSQYKSKNQTGHKFILYDDSTNVETREQQRRVFNSPENIDGKYIKVIIGSPVISEGITLKNVRQVHILEPSWNMSRINQIIGRAVRHHSHDNLSISERNVEIYKYCSVYDSKTTYYIDKEKYLLSEEKDRSNKVIERLLKRLAFDCNNNTQNKKHDKKKENGSAECDYTDCKYSCLIKNGSGTKKLDKFTYNMYINFFDEFDIELNTAFIKDLFMNFIVYSIEDIINKIKSVEPIISTESIYISLKQLIDTKSIVIDQYEREGFLIQKANYIIFNPVDIDINTSLYSKMLDFTVNVNKYTLDKYVKRELDQDIHTQQSSKKEKEKKKTVNVTLSDDDVKYNKKVMKHQIYGSYRERATKKQMFGPIDYKFRIIDMRNIDSTDEDDNRKNISGMAATSYNKKKLLGILEYLKINIKNIQKYLGFPSDNIVIHKLGVEQLVDIIEKHLKSKNLILK